MRAAGRAPCLKSAALGVLDIGKTNKKVAVYSDNLDCLAVRKRTIETRRQDGLDIEDIETVVDWFLGQLKELGAEYPIRSITVTTHGATLVCLDENGVPSVPPVAYTNEVPGSVHEEFWKAAGNSAELQKRTATAEIKPLINPAKLLWFLRDKWPEDFARTRHILFYPQYFAYRLTGRVAADITYTGCHSYLWDFEKNDWSSVADLLGIREMLPEKPGLSADELGPVSAEVAALTGLSPETRVTLGIHDSNSSLVPYLITQNEDFVLNSTGTWCVAMHPEKEVRFTEEELGKMVFYNLSYQGQPVKTSILMGGLEYAFYADLLMKVHGRNDWPDYSPEMYADILRGRSTFILPSIVPGTGQFPESVARVVEGARSFSIDELSAGSLDNGTLPRAFEHYESGFALANLSLAIQTRIALRRVGLRPGTQVFIEGGFRQNANYRALLSALLPENPIFLTALEEATSFGAALVSKALADGVPVGSLGKYVKLDKQPVAPARLDGLEEYAAAFVRQLEK